jgi:hypothetical protein
VLLVGDTEAMSLSLCLIIMYLVADMGCTLLSAFDFVRRCEPEFCLPFGAVCREHRCGMRELLMLLIVMQALRLSCSGLSAVCTSHPPCSWLGTQDCAVRM